MDENALRQSIFLYTELKCGLTKRDIYRHKHR